MASHQNLTCTPRKSIRWWVKNSVLHPFWFNKIQHNITAPECPFSMAHPRRYCVFRVLCMKSGSLHRPHLRFSYWSSANDRLFLFFAVGDIMIIPQRNFWKSLQTGWWASLMHILLNPASTNSELAWSYSTDSAWASYLSAFLASYFFTIHLAQVVCKACYNGITGKTGILSVVRVKPDFTTNNHCSESSTAFLTPSSSFWFLRDWQT